jgi:ribose transport system substrate-binding protein
MKIHHRLHRRGRQVGVALGVASLLAATSACGASHATPKGADQKLKLAFFSVGGNNSYLQAGMQGARDAAKKYNADIEVFDGEFDGAKQLNQVTQAISRGFDGFVIEPNNSTQLCSAVKASLNARIAVGITNVPACDAPYDGVYTGTTIFAGGQSPDVYKQWFEQGLSDSAGGEFAVLNGPATQGNTVRARQVLDDLKSQYPQWKEVAFDYTDYQASIALSKTETILQQHPNLKVIFSSYSGHTPGAVAAIKAAGKTGQVKVYDLGGDNAMFAALKAGQITSTEVYLPYEEQYRAVQSVVARLRGESELDGVTVGKFWDLTTDPKLSGLPAFVDKANLAKYTAIGLPEY